MFKNTLSSWNKRRLQIILSLFFLALAIPTAILIIQAYSQIKWESFHHYRLQAEELSNRIDNRYKTIIERESARSFTDYSFLNIGDDINSKVLQRSPLSKYPVDSTFPGIIGYFQIDNNGQYTSPLLPPTVNNQSVNSLDFGVSVKEKLKRQKLHQQIYQLLSQNKLITQPVVAKHESKDSVTLLAEETEKAIPVQQEALISESRIESTIASEPSPAVSAAPQAAFDQLQAQDTYYPAEKTNSYSKTRKRVEDLKLKKKYQTEILKQEKRSKKKEQQQKLLRRKESNILPDYQSLDKKGKIHYSKNDEALKISMFESEIDAFEFSLLESGHFVLYRKVWRNGLRYIQGLLITPDIFIKDIITDSFYKTSVSITSKLTVAYKGNIISILDSKPSRNIYSSSIDSRGNIDFQGTLLLQNKLSTTLDELELIFSVHNLPAGPGGLIIIWLSIILFIVLCGGFLTLYKLGLKQITLARQQQDFVSAVSHELKTPLTSIRMYGEMLREGWTTEDKRKQYYDYIYDESERLTRLINNVLQLARMTRNELPVDLKAYTIAKIIDTLQSKITSQAERAGFELNLNCDSELNNKTLVIDIDFFIQIFINLVDNAIKFSLKSDNKKIDIHCHLLRNNKVQFCIRDYGPGVNKQQARKIFELFYRAENELTRETVGTGIGLSLVKQLSKSMHASIDIISREPGAEFQITFNGR